MYSLLNLETALTETFKKTTGFAEEAWHHISNIEIACDLTDDAPLEWGCVSCSR